MIKIKVAGLDELIEEIRRLQRPEAAYDDLDRALGRAFDRTQDQVHVEERGLKEGGWTETGHGPSHWAGTIHYGGEGDPGRAAHYELERGGEHDFLRGLDGPEIQEAFESAIDRWVRGQIG